MEIDLKMKAIFTFLALLFAAYISPAQTTFEFIGSEIEPLQEGFYMGGLTFDFNGDGTDEFENGCPSANVDPEDYERRDPFNVTYDAHNESGTYLGWAFKNVMILPDCDQKYIDDETQIDPLVSHGFVQLRPQIDTSNLDISESYIYSPYVRNLELITIETSADISIQQDKRYIPYLIEYSLDSGETFVQDYYIMGLVDIRGGTRKTYNEEYPNFAQMIADSESKNVLLRFAANFDDPGLGAYKGQYVNVHKIMIVADSASAEVPDESIILSASQPLRWSSIFVKDNYICVEEGTVTVYSLSGRLIGTGKSVTVRSGLYVAVSSEGERRKILIRQ